MALSRRLVPVKARNDHGNAVELLYSGLHTVDGPDVLRRHRFPATGGKYGAVLQKQEAVTEPQSQVQVVGRPKIRNGTTKEMTA